MTNVSESWRSYYNFIGGWRCFRGIVDCSFIKLVKAMRISWKSYLLCERNANIMRTLYGYCQIAEHINVNSPLLLLLSVSSRLLVLPRLPLNCMELLPLFHCSASSPPSPPDAALSSHSLKVCSIAAMLCHCSVDSKRSLTCFKYFSPCSRLPAWPATSSLKLMVVSPVTICSSICTWPFLSLTRTTLTTLVVPFSNFTPLTAWDCIPAKWTFCIRQFPFVVKKTTERLIPHCRKR